MGSEMCIRDRGGGSVSSPPGVGRQGLDPNQTAKLVDRVRKRIAGDKSCPVYAGPSVGPLTIANSAVMLQDKVMSVLRTVDSGKMRLEPDVYVNGRYITIADDLTPRRVELLSDLAHEFMSVSQQIANAHTVNVYLLSGEVIAKPHEQVTATDWLRLYVREQALMGGAAELARAALAAMALSPGEGWSSGAARVVSAFRAARADPERPYMTEQAFFWCFVTPVEMTALYDRVVEVLLPNAFDRNGVSAILHEKTYRTNALLSPLRMEWHDPKGAAMTQRGQVAEGLFREFVGVLASRNASYLAPASSKKPVHVGGPDRLYSMAEARSMFANQGHGAPSALPSHPLTKPLAALAPAPVFAVTEAPAPQIAAYQNQTATAPGSHGVPFEARDAPRDARPPAARPAPAPTAPAASATATPPVERPPTSAPRSDVLDYLQSQNLCFRHAFSGRCRRSPCRWSHELPAAFYKSLATRQPGQEGRHRVAAMTPSQYSLACDLGLVNGVDSDSDEDRTGHAASGLEGSA